MDLKQLEYFIAIAEEKNITAAAKRLHICQPPLSQQLKKLEAELGVVLFNRNSRQIQLTEIGKIFLERARQIVDLSSSIQQEVQDYAAGYQGTIMIGITPTSIPMVMNHKLGEFHKKYPKINYKFFEGSTQYVMDILQKELVDIGIVRSPIDTSGYCVVEKPPEPMIAAMNEENNWSDDDFCTIEELESMNLIVYRRYEALLNDVFAVHKISPRIISVSERSFTALLLSEIGLGVSILPASAIKMSNQKVIYKTIHEPILTTNAVALWLPNHHLNKSAKAFLEYFKSLQ